MTSLYHHLPKVELHCHLDGSLSLGAIHQLGKMAHIDLPADDAALAQLVQAPHDAETLMDYLRPFDVIRPLLQTPEALKLAAYDVARQAAEENVRYIEIRFAPEFSMDAGLSVAQTIDAVVSGLHQAMGEFDLVAACLVCGMRQSDPALNQQIFQSSAKVPGLAGFDFAGNEADYPTSVLTNTVKYAQHLGVPLTLHAGECHCVQNIRQAIELGVKRIGHATALHDHPEAIAEFVDAQALAELCLTSNLQTKAAASFDDYPYPELKAAHVRMCINTDNRTVSNTDLTREYQLFAEHFGTSIEDFLQFNRDACAGSFQSKAAIAALDQRLQQEYAQYLS
ncbi:adenosine deaminase [Lacticaseibacillus porcinae]|uniref:adenosine deaminase n=1 Tax=Lacticaseibacillus porcinae TaxID=1123687 RepID=UPI000F7A1A83|nr:adenosine deaminase [Lacticaseibacillus porcinae]